MPRKTVVFSTFGARGDIWPYVAIGQEIVARGGRAIIATDERYGSEILAAGVEFAPTPPTLSDADMAAVMDPAKGSEYLFRRILVPALKDTSSYLRMLCPGTDAIVTHTTSLAGPFMAPLIPGLKWISAVVSPLAMLSLADPPALPIAPGLAKYPALNRPIVELLRLQFGAFLKPVNQYRFELGVGGEKNILTEAAHSPILSLALFSPTLQPPQPDWPKSMRQMGFCFARAPEELPADLKQFLEAGDPPLLFVSGSFSDLESARWVSVGLATARQLGSRVLFLGADSESNAEMFFARYAPLETVLPHVQAMVHHGGIGTFALGLRAGVPMVISPLSHDQPDTARMAVRAGVARSLHRKNLGPIELAAELKIVLGDEGMKRRLKEVRNEISSEPGAKGAATAILDLLD